MYQNLRVRDKILSEEPLYFDKPEVAVELLDAEHDMDMPAEVEVGKLEDAEVFTSAEKSDESESSPGRPKVA